MMLRFQGINPTATPFDSEDHRPKLDWLLDFQVRSHIWYFQVGKFQASFY